MPSFPLVRAASTGPLIRWALDRGVPVDRLLAEAGLGASPIDEPDRFVPFVAALGLLRSLTRQQGPDLPSRVVSAGSIGDLGTLGAVMLAGKTPREALARGAAAMDRYSTHERIMIRPVGDGMVVSEYTALEIDAETRHVLHQYVAALIGTLFGGIRDAPVHIEMAPHPEFGLAHLEGRLGSTLEPTSRRTLSIYLPKSALDRPLPASSGVPGEPTGDWAILSGDRRYSTTARIVVAAMIEDGTLSIERFAAAGGLSVRTLQRRLAEDGTSFSEIVDEVRRAWALRELVDGGAPIAQIAVGLGYSGHTQFVRAVRRWTDRPPREVRGLGRASPDPGGAARDAIAAE